jgi:hypothetical protein
MSSSGTRERELPLIGPARIHHPPNELEDDEVVREFIDAGKQITVSESHPVNRSTGSYDAGGPFYTSKFVPFERNGHVKNAFRIPGYTFYSGPVSCDFPTRAEMEEVGYSNFDRQYGDKNESHMTEKGATAVSLCAPTNPASQLGTTLAETFREGVPSLPGIQLWRDKTKFLKGLGSEYLNYQFGWAPLQDEVHSVVNAARHHRDILNQYHRGEGSDTHRRFEFSLQREENNVVHEGPKPSLPGSRYYFGDGVFPERVISLVRETKCWFEGAFTYALPSSTDSWRKALGFGSDADELFGIAVSPDVLWELTPWSWAVDWFSNAGDVINNVTNFGLAGLVMRYGYVMEESIERVTATTGPFECVTTDRENPSLDNLYGTVATASASGYETVTKRRLPANPFGFGISWQGLSPTQLAITAALGITRLL